MQRPFQRSGAIKIQCRVISTASIVILSHLLEVLRWPSLGGTCRCCHCTCQCPVLNPRLHIGGWDSAQLLWLPEPHFMMLLDVMTAPQHTKLTHQQQANQSSTAMSIAGRGLPATSLAGHPNTACQHTHHRCLHLYPLPAQQPCEPLGLIMTSQQPLATHSLTS